jgi:hypothetical protein
MEQMMVEHLQVVVLFKAAPVVVVEPFLILEMPQVLPPLVGLL